MKIRQPYRQLKHEDGDWREEGEGVLRAATDQHRLLDPKKTSCWILFIMFGLVQERGFYTRRCSVHHEPHLEAMHSAKESHVAF